MSFFNTHARCATHVYGAHSDVDAAALQINGVCVVKSDYHEKFVGKTNEKNYVAPTASRSEPGNEASSSRGGWGLWMGTHTSGLKDLFSLVKIWTCSEKIVR